VLRLGADVVRDVARAATCEWLSADGVGGWAASTVLGLNTRAGHGLLVSGATAKHPRLVLLSRVEEAVSWDGARYELGTNDYGDAVHPRGFEHADAFVLDPLPTLTWEVAGRRLSRTVARVHGEAAVVIAYQLEGPEPVTLEVRPLLAIRELDARQRENAAVRAEPSGPGPDVVVQPYEGCPPLALRMPGGSWEAGAVWYRGFRYAREAEAGAAAQEDLFSPGLFRVVLRPGTTAVLMAWAGAIPPATDPLAKVAGERRRVRALGDANEGFLPDLRRAADAFLVRIAGTRTILAGYPSAVRSAREGLIALPGLCLATGRHDEARAILLALTTQVEGPRAAGRADEAHGGDAFDTGLWWVIAVERFREATGDHEFIRARLQGALVAILEGYRAGTRPGVGVSPEGLLAHEDDANPLGPAMAAGGATTGRRGFAVEVQALWYCALLVGADLARAAGQSARAGEWTALASRVRESFLRAFWSERQGHLADVVDGTGADLSLRPYQLYAIGLPHALLPRDKAQRILDTVRRHLVTPVGLRSLAPTDARYVGSPSHDALAPLDRGAAWPSLAALYFDALIRVHGEAAKAEAWRWVDGFAPQLGEGTLGTVPAALEGDAPHRPIGDMASARSVAEVLRLVLRLGRRPSGRVARPEPRG
jgi:predicted glycogen debranching enzyme